MIDLFKMIRVSKIILINKKREILLVLRDNYPTICYPGYWDFLGGIIEEGETPILALRREIFEEIEGFVLNDLEDIKFLENIIVGIDKENNHNEEANNYIFVGILNIPLKKIKLKDEGQDLKFFSAQEIINLKKFPEHFKKIIKLRFIKNESS